MNLSLGREGRGAGGFANYLVWRCERRAAPKFYCGGSPKQAKALYEEFLRSVAEISVPVARETFQAMIVVEW